MRVTELSSEHQVRLGKLVFQMQDMKPKHMTMDEAYLGALQVYGEALGVNLECPHRWHFTTLEYPVYRVALRNPHTCEICGTIEYYI